uniref:glycosyltransferase family 9 protein n=1 Tax=Thaumasiovibrio occultus TaxID=1891184 RepID=UPI000B350F56|nr:glycosyltransferase family 9 protein [Thaumasiovibrio occultus]
MQPLFSSAPKSICILRLSAIGDVCHAIAAVQAIQRHWPDTQITWIAGKIESQLLTVLPEIRVVTFDKSQGFKGMKAVWNALNNEKFDALLHMQVALRASVLSWGIKAKHKVGFSKDRAKEGQWLFTNRKITNTSTSSHVLDNFADFVRDLGVPFDKPEWHIPLPEAAIEFAHQTIQNPTVIISPAASKDERNWLPERYADVINHAHQKGIQVILTGSPAERELQLGREISDHCTQAPLNLIGQTSLLQLMSLLKLADVVIAPDSGPAHMATTQGTPVIGLYAHSDPRRTGPYNSLVTTINAYDEIAQEQHGKPAEQLPWGTRNKGKDLMSRIETSAVIAKVDALLQD